MRKRNHTVTIRMNKAEYDLLQSKVKESGKTQQEVVIKAIADLKIASAEEVTDQIDWDCKVHRMYQEKNYGCDPSEYISYFVLFV